MAAENQDAVTFYRTAGPLTEVSRYSDLLKDLPDTVEELVGVIQGLLLHIFWAGRYGEMLSTRRKEEVNIRTAEGKIARILEIDPAALVQARPLNQRLIGNCRDFSLLLAALLKFKGIPARARCGFATYFIKGKYEDHWVVEYWQAEGQRWVMVDAQLDAFQCEHLKIQFDPLDMPAGQFLPAGQAWQMCRKNQADPLKFGIQQYHGMEFILGDVQRDLLALNRIELLPWDIWGLAGKRFKDLTREQLALIDRIALFTLLPDSPLTIIRQLYEENAILHAPQDWLSGVRLGFYR